jgi:hypothetical protein
MADWVVICSCGWTREASSAWAATAVARHLGAPGIEHIITTIKEPPADAPLGSLRWPRPEN